MWNYLTAPYLLTRPGVVVEELEFWREPDEDWRRLRARFPEALATHCLEQVFYYDTAGLLRRHDYAPDVLGGTPAAHFSAHHVRASGLVFPTHRFVVPVQEDGRAASEPVLITIDLANISVTWTTDRFRPRSVRRHVGPGCASSQAAPDCDARRARGRSGRCGGGRTRASRAR
ncbi:hypothetical protein ACWFRK_41625 [Streptomyces sp. NPDC055157]